MKLKLAYGRDLSCRLCYQEDFLLVIFNIAIDWVLRRTHRRTGTFRIGRGGDLIARKKLHNARQRELYTRTQIAVKTKTFPILTSNETIIIPKTQRNSEFWNLQGKRKLLLKIGELIKY